MSLTRKRFANVLKRNKTSPWKFGHPSSFVRKMLKNAQTPARTFENSSICQRFFYLQLSINQTYSIQHIWLTLSTSNVIASQHLIIILWIVSLEYHAIKTKCGSEKEQLTIMQTVITRAGLLVKRPFKNCNYLNTQDHAFTLFIAVKNDTK